MHFGRIATLSIINIKRSIDSKFLAASLVAFQVNKLPGAAGVGMDNGQALWSEIIFRCGMHEVAQSGGRIDKRDTPSGGQQVLCGPEHIRQSRGQFMPRDCLLLLGIYASCSGFPIGRIAEYKIETPGIKRGSGFPEIRLHYFDGSFQAVFPDIGVGDGCQLGLYLQSGDPAVGFFSEREDERNDAAACSQFDNTVLSLDLCEPSEQDCIQRKAISSFFLADK